MTKIAQKICKSMNENIVGCKIAKIEWLLESSYCEEARQAKASLFGTGMRLSINFISYL